MDIDSVSSTVLTAWVSSATDGIARFSGSPAVLLLLVECSPQRCRPCRARLRLQAQTVSQAVSTLPETPATPLLGNRKNAHSHLSNCRF